MKSLIKIVTLLSCALTLSTGRAEAPTAPTKNVDWLAYGNDPRAHRFSPLKDIDKKNVSKLKAICQLDVGEQGAFQSGFVVVGGVLFATTAHSTIALDATTCEVKWRHHNPLEKDEMFPVNRGVAYYEGKLIRGTPDGHLLAIDAATGKELWYKKHVDAKENEFYSAAPVAWGGLVFMGPAGSDWGARGRLEAFDVNTGEKKWSFNLVPQKGEPGFETWKNPESAKTGGGATWTSYTIDPEAGEVFTPAGNPYPDFAPTKRPGDNLYTNGFVVLDAKTGKYKWHYQLRPNDGFDYDLAAAPVVTSDRVVVGGKDGFVYSVDRKTHKLVWKTATTTIKNADKNPTPKGILACPGPIGGTEWNGPALDEGRGLLYSGTTDWCAVYSTKPQDPEIAKAMHGLDLGGTYTLVPAAQAKGWVYAVDAKSGKVKWKYKAAGPVIAGVTPTAGGIVLTGDNKSNLLAFDADNGKVLLKKKIQGALGGGVVTYSVGGQQYVAVASGNVSRAAFGSASPPAVVIMKVSDEKENTKLVKVQIPKEENEQAASIPPGQKIYMTYCAACHGPNGEGTSGPSLKGIAKRRDAKNLIEWIKHPSPQMPKFYPAQLKDEDVKMVADFISKY